MFETLCKAVSRATRDTSPGATAQPVSSNPRVLLVLLLPIILVGGAQIVSVLPRPALMDPIWTLSSNALSAFLIVPLPSMPTSGRRLLPHGIFFKWAPSFILFWSGYKWHPKCCYTARTFRAFIISDSLANIIYQSSHSCVHCNLYRLKRHFDSSF